MRLSEIEAGIRIDAELYQKHYLKVEASVKSLPFCVLNDITTTVKKGIFDINASCYSEIGIPFVRITNLRNMVTDDSDVILIPESEHQNNLDTRLLRNDVVLSKTAYAAASLVTFDECNVSQDTVAVKLMPDSVVNSHTLVAFLNSRYGLLQMQRWFTGNIQMHLNLTDCKGLLIPVFSETFQRRIKGLFQESIAAKEQSKRLYAEAESLLLNELGLRDWKPTEENTAVKSFKESFLASGRIDAEFYQPKYDVLLKLIKSYKNGFCQLKDVGKFTNGSFISDVFYTDKGKRAYIRIKELSLNSPIDIEQVVFIDDNFQRTNETVVETNDFVIATIGNTIGKVSLIPSILSGSFPSNNTSKFSINDKQANFFYYEVLLRNLVVQEQVQREFTQTAQPKISNESLSNILIPNIPSQIQIEISEMAQTSFYLNGKSKRLLETAKRGVEIAIEQDEQAALKWIDDEIHLLR